MGFKACDGASAKPRWPRVLTSIEPTEATKLWNKKHVAIKIPTSSIRNMFLFAGMFHLRSSQKFESLVSIETIYQKKQVAINYKVPSFSRSRLKSTKIPLQKKAPFVGRFFPSWQRWPSTSAGHFALPILQGIARCSWDFTGKTLRFTGIFWDLLGTIIWIMISIYHPTKILRSHGRMMVITVGKFHGVGI